MPGRVEVVGRYVPCMCPAADANEEFEVLVGGLDEEELRHLLTVAAAAHEDVGRAVRLAAADEGGRLAVLRVEVDRGLRTRRFLGYRESAEWALEAAPVVDALETAVAAGVSRELVELVERAVGHVVKVILRADDSDGLIGDLARRLLDLHAMACDAGVADPVRLARWMVRFTFDDQDFFVVDPVRYRAALGEKGLAVYRGAVAKRSEDTGGYAARYAEERLAVLDADIDRIVGLLGGDLSAPYQFIRLAEAMRELDRSDDALVWARRGIAETTGWQVGKLYDLAADVLTDRGDAAAVANLRRDQHERMPSSTSYALLQSAAVAVGTWDDERSTARSLLAARDRGGFIDALLADGDDEQAWTVASSGEGWDPGEGRWLELAKTREPTHPADAMTVYLHLADAALVNANRGAYRVAVRHLKAACRAAAAAGETAAFADHLVALRDQHRRGPSLIEMLDRADLS